MDYGEETPLAVALIDAMCGRFDDTTTRDQDYF